MKMGFGNGTARILDSQYLRHLFPGMSRGIPPYQDGAVELEVAAVVEPDAEDRQRRGRLCAPQLRALVVVIGMADGGIGLGHRCGHLFLVPWRGSSGLVYLDR
jgi:hypothetical protein